MKNHIKNNQKTEENMAVLIKKKEESKNIFYKGDSSISYSVMHLKVEDGF